MQTEEEQGQEEREEAEQEQGLVLEAVLRASTATDLVSTWFCCNNRNRTAGDDVEEAEADDATPGG